MKPYQMRGEILRHLRILLSPRLYSYPQYISKAPKQIYFFNNNNNAASAYLRAQQLCEITSQALKTSLIDDLSAICDHSIVIGTKGTLPILAKAVKQRPQPHVRFYYDPVDQLLAPAELEVPDGLIASSYRQYLWLRTRIAKPVFLIPHHADCRIKQHVRPDAEFRVAYFGDGKNAFLCGSLEQQVDVFQVRSHTNTEWMGKLTEYPLHYCIRRKPEKSHAYNPATKLFIAARAGAAVITTRDESDAELLLPPDYPFFCHTRSEKAVQEILTFAYESFGTPVFAKAVSDVAQIRGWREDEQIQQLRQVLTLSHM
jgi:hypothetical protein